MSHRTAVTALAVGKYGTERYRKIIRLLCNVDSNIGRRLANRVAASKIACPTGHLFTKSANDGRIVIIPQENGSSMDFAKRCLLKTCEVLIAGQRCADWMIQRQFRETATNAGKISLRDSNGGERQANNPILHRRTSLQQNFCSHL